MDFTELVCHAARSEAKSLRPAQEEEDVDRRVPFFRIQKKENQLSNDSSYTVTGHNCAGHDNEPRMEFICGFLTQHVLPYVDARLDVSGFYNIELHDSYSYLPNAGDYRNCLTFSRKMNDMHMTLLPNPYQIANYGDAFDANADNVPWDQKSDRLFFAGSTTGDRNPTKNLRIHACKWSLQNPAISDFKITNVVQMNDHAFRVAVPEWRSIVAPPVPQADNYKHKFLVNLPGNTAAWSRVPMIMASKSIMLSMYHEDIEWFYPFLLEGTHFLGFTMETLASKRAFALSNPQITQYIIANANRFHSAFMGRNQAALYTLHLLEEVARRTGR
jgi:Glycosyl transferase family 90